MATSLIDFNALRPNAAMEAYQQGQQNQLAQMQLGQQQQAIRDAEAEREAYKGAANFGEVSQRLMKQGLGKQALAVSAAEAKQRADKIALLKDTTALMKNTATQIMANPAIAKEALVAFGQQTGTDVSRDLAQLNSYGGNADAIKQWAAGHALEADKLLPKFQHFDTGGAVQTGTTDYTGKFTPTQTINKTMSPSDKISAGQLEVSRRREARLNEGSELKPVPVHAQKAMTGAASTLGQLDAAIAALKANPSSVGLIGLTPDIALNRMDPEGTAARAALADIGSLKLHERSGAAVTASETPRLKPFIPSITDDYETALKKLERMRDIQAAEEEVLTGTYNKEQGFRDFRAATPSGAGKPAAPAAPMVPKAGIVQDGYRFKGGNPADPKSWEKM